MRSAAGWTLVFALRAGPLKVAPRFDPRRLVAQKARCSRATRKPASGV
jgi:hypothetical protein